MNEIVLSTIRPDRFFQQLHHAVKGTLSEQFGEQRLSFDNEFGTGVLQTVRFDRGISLLSCDLQLASETAVLFDTPDTLPIEFIFISEGDLKYRETMEGEITCLEQFQNIILAPRQNTLRTFILPEGKRLRINYIQLIKEEYLQKKHMRPLSELLSVMYSERNHGHGYINIGNFSLNIAEEVKQLNTIKGEGVIRTLLLEGRVHLVLALQIEEQHHFQQKDFLHGSLSKADISRIHKLTAYILDNISNTISMNVLKSESGLSPKKLQLGFRMLFSKTVNEYVRDLKLEIAREYLKNTDLSVSEVVYAIGISSRSYFSKIFFEAYAILPTEYRKKLNAGPAFTH